MNIQAGGRDHGSHPSPPPLHPRRQERFTNEILKSRLQSVAARLRKSRSSKRSGSNSQTSFKASLRDRPLADSPKSTTKAKTPQNPFIHRSRPKAGAQLAMMAAVRPNRITIFRATGAVRAVNNRFLQSLFAITACPFVAALLILSFCNDRNDSDWPAAFIKRDESNTPTRCGGSRTFADLLTTPSRRLPSTYGRPCSHSTSRSGTGQCGTAAGSSRGRLRRSLLMTCSLAAPVTPNRTAPSAIKSGMSRFFSPRLTSTSALILTGSP